MYHCPRCRIELSASAAFCNNCGFNQTNARLASIAAQHAPGKPEPRKVESIDSGPDDKAPLFTPNDVSERPTQSTPAASTPVSRNADVVVQKNPPSRGESAGKAIRPGIKRTRPTRLAENQATVAEKISGPLPEPSSSQTERDKTQLSPPEELESDPFQQGVKQRRGPIAPENVQPIRTNTPPLRPTSASLPAPQTPPRPGKRAELARTTPSLSPENRPVTKAPPPYHKEEAQRISGPLPAPGQQRDEEWMDEGKDTPEPEIALGNIVRHPRLPTEGKEQSQVEEAPKRLSLTRRYIADQKTVEHPIQNMPEDFYGNRDFEQVQQAPARSEPLRNTPSYAPQEESAIWEKNTTEQEALPKKPSQPLANQGAYGNQQGQEYAPARASTGTAQRGESHPGAYNAAPTMGGSANPQGRGQVSMRRQERPPQRPANPQADPMMLALAMRHSLARVRAVILPRKEAKQSILKQYWKLWIILTAVLLSIILATALIFINRLGGL